MQEEATGQMEGAKTPEDEEISNGHAGGSNVLSYLRDRRKKLQQERHLDMDIAGYGGKLVCRFNPADVDDLAKIGRLVDKVKVGTPEFLGATDVLIKACQQLMFRDPDHPMAEEETGLVGLHEYDEIDTDIPIKFDERLVDVLGLENAKKSRAIVWRTFENNYAVMVAYNNLMEWQEDTDAAVDGDLLGESQGAR